MTSDAPAPGETSPKRWSGGTVLLVAAVVVVAGVAVWAYLGTRDDSSDEPFAGRDRTDSVVLGMADDSRAEVGRPAPDFTLVSGRDPSKVISLSDFLGTPVVLNWYATWCGPCRNEIPDFQAAVDTLGDDIVILSVNLQESADDAVGLLDELGATFPTVMDADGSVYQHYRGIGMPTTYFIDAEGIIVEGGSGVVTEDALVTALANVGVAYSPPESD